MLGHHLFAYHVAQMKTLFLDLETRLKPVDVPEVPMKAFLLLLKRWRLDLNDGAILLGLPSDDSRNPQVRLRTVLQIYAIVYSLLRDADAENRWIRDRRPELENASLLDTMLRGNMENLILANEFVEEFSAR